MASISFLKPLRFPLFWQILCAMGFLLSLTIGILWGYLSFNFNHLLKQQSDTFAHTISQQLADSSAELLMAEDTLALSAMLENLTEQNGNIQYIAIYDHKNILIRQAGELKQAIAPGSTPYFMDVTFHGVKAGQVQLHIDNRAIVASLENTQTTLGILASILAILAFATSIYLAKNLTAPLKRLQKVATSVSQGELNPKLPHSMNDEVGDLIKSMDKMLQGLRDKVAIENTFSSYISKDIAKDILSDLSRNIKPLKTVTGSVLFVDIVGFTKMSEEQNPTDIAEILNEYYFLLHQAAKMYRGSVDNYIGDGAMLTFGVHKQDHKHALNGICAGQIFIRLIQNMNDKRRDQGKDPVNFRLGLHCGEMLAGTIGSSERMQFTISGDTVNLAARLCDHGDANALLISQNVYDSPQCNGLIKTTKGKAYNFKGKTQTITGYNVLGLSAKFNRILMEQESEMRELQHG